LDAVDVLLTLACRGVLEAEDVLVSEELICRDAEDVLVSEELICRDAEDVLVAVACRVAEDVTVPETTACLGVGAAVMVNEYCACVRTGDAELVGHASAWQSCDAGVFDKHVRIAVWQLSNAGSQHVGLGLGDGVPQASD